MDKIVLNEREEKLYNLAKDSTGLLDPMTVMTLYANLSNLSSMSPEFTVAYSKVIGKLYQDGVIK